MYHSVTFGEKNTWDDWGLVAEERPYITPPVPKTNFVDIPGASSKLDFSEELTGYPTYENRTGSIEFIITDQYISNQTQRWQNKYSEIMAYISGRRLKMILEDDFNYFYEGRFYVESYKPGTSASDSFSKISINYDVGPYKWTLSDSLDSDWLWDPFSFVDGVILSKVVKDISLTTTEKTLELPKELIGIAPFCPEFIITPNTTGANAIITIINDELNINKEKVIGAGTWTFYDVIFWANVLDNSKTIIKYRMQTGTGKMSMRYRKGGL